MLARLATLSRTSRAIGGTSSTWSSITRIQSFGHVAKKTYSTSHTNAKSFWWVTIPAGLVALAGMLLDIKHYFDVKDMDLGEELTPLLPNEAIEFWKSLYHSLMEGWLWEPYLKKGIVQKALEDIRGTHPLLLAYDLNYLQELRLKAQKMKDHNAEWLKLTSIVIANDRAATRSARIVKTLQRLCEMEGVADEIITSGGLEVIAKTLATGRYRARNYSLFFAVCSHDSLHEKIISRPEFIPLMKQLIESKAHHDEYVAYGILQRLVSNEPIGRKLFYSRDFEELREIVEKYENKNDAMRTMAKCFDNKRRYWPDLVKRFPVNRTFDLSLGDLTDTAMQFAVAGFTGALYCGLNWKGRLPSTSIMALKSKFAWGFAVSASPLIIRFTSHLMYSETAKMNIEQRVYQGRQHSKVLNLTKGNNILVAPITLVAADAIRWTLFLSLAKFVVLPAVLTGFFQVVEFPTANEWKAGKRLKLKYT